MRTVRVRAANLKPGDVFNHQRIREVIRYSRRCRRKSAHHKLAYVGVLVIAPNPSGNKLDTFDIIGDTWINVKRPQYNMQS